MVVTTLANSSKPTLNESARLKCEAALELKDRGLYEKAFETMRPFCNRVGERPSVSGLHPAIAAELLLVAGILTRWIGGKNQIKDFSEVARDLISESLAYWESERDLWKVAEARAELGWCYWRSGALDEARILFTEALKRLTAEGNTRASALLGLSFVEWSASRYYDALAILTANSHLFAKITNNTTKGNHHNQCAMIFRSLASAQGRSDYFERAISEYQEADRCFELARHTVFRANVKNNVGFLLFKLGRLKAANDYFIEARRLAVIAKDKTLIAQFDDSRAKLLIATGQFQEAEGIARSAVNALEKGGHQNLLADTLITYGVALARLNQAERARFTLQRAIEVAHSAGAPSTAGLAALTLIEELDGLSSELLLQAYEQAGEWLSTCQSTELWQRLASAGMKVARELGRDTEAHETTLFNKPCDLEDEVLRFERRLISQALTTANGKITHAAKLLNVGRQKLAYTIAARHPDLLNERTPVLRRPSYKRRAKV